MKPKSAAQSQISAALVVLPYHTNLIGNMHGGEVMRFMDSTAGIVAQRHSLCNPVTVSVDELVFQEKIKVGDLIVCEAELVFTGRTSMGIKVRIKKKNFKTEKSDKYAIEGNWVMVALDENRRPIPVPPLIIESPEQQKLFDDFKAKLIKKDER